MILPELRVDPPGLAPADPPRAAQPPATAPAQLPLFDAADLAPAGPGKTRLPGRIRTILAALEGRRRGAADGRSGKPTAPPGGAPSRQAGWPDSFFDEPA